MILSQSFNRTDFDNAVILRLITNRYSVGPQTPLCTATLEKCKLFAFMMEQAHFKCHLV